MSEFAVVFIHVSLLRTQRRRWLELFHVTKKGGGWGCTVPGAAALVRTDWSVRFGTLSASNALMASTSHGYDGQGKQRRPTGSAKASDHNQVTSGERERR